LFEYCSIYSVHLPLFVYEHLLRQILRHTNTKNAIYRSTTATDATLRLRKKPEILGYFCDQLLKIRNHFNSNINI
jgi:hypothetical protein